MRNISLKTKILVLALAPFVLFNMVMMANSYVSTKNALMEEKKTEIKDVIYTSLGAIQSLDRMVKDKKMPLEEAQEIAKKYLTEMRYGKEGNDYIWVNDFSPAMVVHPSKALVGKSLKKFKDKAGSPLFTDIVNLVNKEKEGFIQYLWVSKTDKEVLAPKLSFVKGYKPWGWILGTGIYLDDVDAYINQVMLEYLIYSVVGLVIMTIVISIILNKGVVTPLLNIADRLGSTSQHVTQGSEETLETSETLSKATSDQAASLQQTVASIDEISSMINRNSDSANASKETSLDSQRAAEKGKGTVDEMLASIRDITENNKLAMEKMSEGNNQFLEILNIIREIDDKTKVINDIVFQTKLLSFNASVEAARAGESGKGFAVVAEEVGNLATMSGNASDEIRHLIDQSIKQVEGIVEQNTGMVDNLIEGGKDTVARGTQKANECKEALDEILDNVKNVNSKVNEIAHACEEQAVGVDEITKAMRLLDQVTHQNNDASRRASENASDLQEQANQLDNVVHEVMTLVNGDKSA